MMKVTVFGGTGAIGRELVTDLVVRRYEVTVFVSDCRHAPTTWGQDVKVVSGELTDAAAVDAAMACSDTVINALNPRLRPRCRQQCLVEGTKHILASMQRHGVRRYIGHGTPGVTLCPKERLNTHIRWHRFLVQSFHPHAQGAGCERRRPGR